MKKAGKAIHGAKAAIQSTGYLWENAQMHEHEVNLLKRFLVDCSMSSGTCIVPQTCLPESFFQNECQ